MLEITTRMDVADSDGCDVVDVVVVEEVVAAVK